MQLRELKRFCEGGFVNDVCIEELEDEGYGLLFTLTNGETHRLRTSKDTIKVYKSAKAVMNELRFCSIKNVRLEWKEDSAA